MLSVAPWPRPFSSLLNSCVLCHHSSSSGNPISPQKSPPPNLGKGVPTVLARRDLVGSRLGCQRLMKGQEWEGPGEEPHFTRAEVMLENLSCFPGHGGLRGPWSLENDAESCRVAPGLQRLVRPLETRGCGGVGLGCGLGWAGLSRQPQACRQRRAWRQDNLIPPSFPLVFLCVGGGSEGSGMGERFSKKSQEKKRLKHQVLGSQIASPEKSPFVPC